jgi:REP element-mobilizing transposase RayT
MADPLKITEHGADVGKGQRKGARPFAGRLPLYVIMRSTRARGPWSMKRPAIETAISSLLLRLSNQYGVRVHEFANAGSQLHLILQCKNRDGLKKFLRSFAGLTARAVTGARKGVPSGRFWDWTAYSRVLGEGELEPVRRQLRGDGKALVTLVPSRPTLRSRTAAARSPKERVAVAASRQRR